MMRQYYPNHARLHFYCGSRAEEIPRSIELENRRLSICHIVDESVIGASDPAGSYYRCFTVETEDGSFWKLTEGTAGEPGWLIEPIVL